MTRRNWIAEFTEEEVVSALRLVGTPESAAAVAAELYTSPPDDQAYFEWTYDALRLLSCVSDELAQRVLDVFAVSPESGGIMKVEQAEFCKMVSDGFPNAPITFQLCDVVYDTRDDCAVMAEVRAADLNGPRNYIQMFSEDELRTALALYGNPDSAAAIAGSIYGLPVTQQVRLDWTDTALWLLSAVSPALEDRIATNLGISPELAHHIREMQRVFRNVVDSGALITCPTELRLEGVVRESQTP